MAALATVPLRIPSPQMQAGALNRSFAVVAGGACPTKDSGIHKFVNDRPQVIRPNIESRDRDRQLEPPWPRASRIEIEDAVEGIYPGHM